MREIIHNIAYIPDHVRANFTQTFSFKMSSVFIFFNIVQYILYDIIQYSRIYIVQYILYNIYYTKLHHSFLKIQDTFFFLFSFKLLLSYLTLLQMEIIVEFFPHCTSTEIANGYLLELTENFVSNLF